MIREGVILGERYEVRERIGTGGMAEVYRGKDQKLNRFVAIKVLKKEYREDEVFVRKFRAEAQSAAGLMNPNIVNVYDVGEDRGLYYIIMELVEGITLKDYIEKKDGLSAKETISISIQICNGVEAAHSHHIIHRDIKPQNIMISKEGKVKVMDFGIARVASSTTVSSNAMGSVHYTSPEQARGGFSDEKSDIYSVGITMYEMVTGRVPFDGESTVSIAIKHLQEEITPPSVYVPDIPYSLEQIILKCTQKNADKRYPNATLLIMDLKRALVDPQGHFVSMLPYEQGTDTVMITDEDMSRIQSLADEYDEDDDYDDDYDDDDYDYDDDDEYDDYDDDEDDGYDDDDTGYDSPGKGQDVNPKMAKIMKILAVVLGVVIIFVMIYMIGQAAGLFKQGLGSGTKKEETNQVEVPNVVGKTEDEAASALNKKGLGFKVITRESSTEYDAGIVTEQKTEAGTKVDKNTEIQVIVSLGKEAETVTVPDVTGMSESQAQSSLTSKGFTIGNTTYDYSDDVNPSDVISTSPAANTSVEKGSSIDLVVSKGSKPVEKATVPNLVGRSREDAEAALNERGLVLGDVSEIYDSNEAGIVINQSPSSGGSVAAGSTVSITVSKGEKPEEKSTVPNVVGIMESDARSMISEAGLTVSVNRQADEAPAGTVIYQSIEPEEQVSPGQTLSITVSTGPGEAPAEDGGQEEPPAEE